MIEILYLSLPPIIMVLLMKNITTSLLAYRWQLFLSLLLMVTHVSCRHGDNTLYDGIDDLAGKHLAVYHGVLSDSLSEEYFPGASLKHYDKTLNIFLDLEAGICDAVVMDTATAAMVVDMNRDYVCLGKIDLSQSSVERVSVIIPLRKYAFRNHDESSIEMWKDRIYRNLFSDNSLKLIVGGLYTTVVIFIGAAVFAFLLAVLLTYMGINHKWGWLYHPLHWFVFTIHDIPSVVLMMFFYYVVFASSSLSGVVVAAIALGVYTSASLTKIFKIHITQVSKEQREAGLVLGLTSRQVYYYIVFPQAVRVMMPLLIAELKLLLRSTSYAGYIAQKDLVKAVDAIRGVTYDAFLPLLIVSLLYLLLSWLITKSVEGLCKKLFIHD